jgi:hypothetical protein
MTLSAAVVHSANSSSALRLAPSTSSSVLMPRASMHVPQTPISTCLRVRACSMRFRFVKAVRHGLAVTFKKTVRERKNKHMPESALANLFHNTDELFIPYRSHRRRCAVRHSCSTTR